MAIAVLLGDAGAGPSVGTFGVAGFTGSVGWAATTFVGSGSGDAAGLSPPLHAIRHKNSTTLIRTMAEHYASPRGPQAKLFGPTGRQFPALARLGDLDNASIVMRTITRVLKSSAAWAALFTGLFLGKSAASDGTPPPQPLPGGGRLVTRVENQRRSPVCEATRTWVEVEGTGQPAAENLINTRIRKQITVGRQLKDDDCPGPEDEENYRYINRIEVSGIWHRFLGTRTTVCFPGGTGRCVLSCEVFDLQTGQHRDLKKFVDPRAQGALDRLLNQQAKADDFPSGYLPLKAKESAICLENHGVVVVYMNDSGNTTTSITIGRPQISKYFRLSSELASDLASK
jgi:hypothetical protein